MTTETNAERLEQAIEYRNSLLLLVAAGVLNKKFLADFEWLIDQVEKLSNVLKQNEYNRVSWKEGYERLEEENTRLREALELIRNDTYWEDEDIVSVRHVIRKRAEKALAGEANGQHQA